MSELTPVTVVETIPPAKQLTLAVQSTGLEASSAQQVLGTFEPYLQQAEEWAKKVALIKVTAVSQTREMKLAHDTRMALREIRIKAEAARKRLKEDSLRQGKAIDGAYNIIEFIIAPLEKDLKAQEDFALNKELERKTALKQERTDKLVPLLLSPQELVGLVLEEMTPETFEQVVVLKQAAADARAESARKAEADRIAKETADKKAADDQAAENLRLKKLADDQAAQLKRDKDAADAEAKRLKDIADKATADAKALRDAETKRKADADAASKRADDERFARERKAAAAPDKEKLLAYIKALREVTIIGELASNDGRKIAAQVKDYLQDFTTELEEAVNTL